MKLILVKYQTDVSNLIDAILFVFCATTLGILDYCDYFIFPFLFYMVDTIGCYSQIYGCFLLFSSYERHAFGWTVKLTLGFIATVPAMFFLCFRCLTRIMTLFVYILVRMLKKHGLRRVV